MSQAGLLRRAQGTVAEFLASMRRWYEFRDPTLMSALGERIRKVLSLDPTAGAVEFAGHWYSWGQLAAIVAALAAELRASGHGADTRVGLVLRNAPEMVGAMLGTIASEGCIVSLNPHQGDLALSRDVRNVRVPIVVACRDDWSREGFADAVRETGGLGLIADCSVEPPLRHVPGLEVASGKELRRTAHGVAVEMLTSGTTGPPKRVLLSYEAFERNISAASERFRRKQSESENEAPRLSRGVAIINGPFVHMSGLFRTLLNVSQGRRIALMDKFRVEQWVDLVRRHRPKAVGLVPAAVQMVLDADVKSADLEGIEVATCGSASLDLATQDAFEARFGIPVLTMYGATEFGSLAGWTLPLRQEWANRKRGSVGRPVPGRELRIVNQTTGLPLEANQKGLVEVFVDRQWVRTNDFARIDEDKFIWMLGRADDVILRGGFKIVPNEVARVLCRHPDVREVSVVGIPDSRLGQVPVAALELHAGRSLSADELREFARQNLTAYQLPVQIRIVDALPRTASMKVSEPDVREIFERS